jgi:hypothetical protein
MKRENSQELAVRPGEVVRLAHSHLVHGGWAQAAVASHLKVPQGAASRELAAMRDFWRDFPVYDFEKRRFERATYAQNGRVYAHQGPLCASACIFVEPCVSHSGIRTFGDFPIHASDIMEFENAARTRMQVIGGQWEAATVSASVS